MKKLTFEDIRNSGELNAYIQKGNELLGVLGYTDHSEAHTLKVALHACDILKELGYDERTAELAKMAGYIHDMGNMINRVEHAQTGAIMAFNILTRMGMEYDEIAVIVGAVGNHDEDAGTPVSPASAALIIADKSDVRRSRVRNNDPAAFDIHDRVNYAVIDSAVGVDGQKREVFLKIKIDTKMCSIIDYFEIFLSRMLMCKRAAEFLSARFRLDINDTEIM